MARRLDLGGRLTYTVDMPALLRSDQVTGLGFEVDERDARLELRRQISRLEGKLAAIFSEAFGHTEVPHRIDGIAAAPRVLDLGELEVVRDRLADRIAEARSALSDRSQVEETNRQLLREMLDAPERHKWVRVSRADVGEPGCGGWHSRPRLGMIGMLMGWWRVKVSSGCPRPGRLAAAGGRRRNQESKFEHRTSAHPLCGGTLRWLSWSSSPASSPLPSVRSAATRP